MSGIKEEILAVLQKRLLLYSSLLLIFSLLPVLSVITIRERTLLPGLLFVITFAISYVSVGINGSNLITLTFVRFFSSIFIDAYQTPVLRRFRWNGALKYFYLPLIFIGFFSLSTLGSTFFTLFCLIAFVSICLLSNLNFLDVLLSLEVERYTYAKKLSERWVAINNYFVLKGRYTSFDGKDLWNDLSLLEKKPALSKDELAQLTQDIDKRIKILEDVKVVDFNKLKEAYAPLPSPIVDYVHLLQPKSNFSKLISRLDRLFEGALQEAIKLIISVVGILILIALFPSLADILRIALK